MRTADVTAAYSTTGAAWQTGPGRIYDRLAAEVVARLPAWRPGAHVLDLGAGTGAASRAVAARGGAPIALDAAFGMLAAGSTGRPPAVCGDASALPFRGAVFDAVVAAFSLNHLQHPVDGLREVARVLRPGAPVALSAYADDDRHPAKNAVDEAAAAFGWQRPAWYDRLRMDAIPLLATAERATQALRDAGLDGTAEHVDVAFAELAAGDLVAWRLGMAQFAPFVRELDVATRTALVDRALERLGTAPPLVRSVIVAVGSRPTSAPRRA